MSSKTKRKYVYQEHMEDVAAPSNGQVIGRVLATRGNNLHQVEDANGEVYLASMPPKFRKNIWVRRGSFLLLEPIAEGDKVRAEVVQILSRDHIVELNKLGVWPVRFEAAAPSSKVTPDTVNGLESLSLGEGNPNRPAVCDEQDSDSSEDSSDDGESDDSDGEEADSEAEDSDDDEAKDSSSHDEEDSNASASPR